MRKCFCPSDLPAVELVVACRMILAYLAGLGWLALTIGCILLLEKNDAL